MNYFRYALITLLCKIKELMEYSLKLLSYSPSDDSPSLIHGKLIQEKVITTSECIRSAFTKEVLSESVFLSLPDDVLKLIFTWMALRDVVKLDSAMTSHSCRKMWLKTSGRLFCHPGYIFQSKVLVPGRNNVGQMFHDPQIVPYEISIRNLPQRPSCLLRIARNRLAIAHCEILKIWDAVRPDGIVSIVGHSYDIRSIVELSDGQIASASNDSLRIWDINKQPPELTAMFPRSLYYLIPLSNCRLFAASWLGDRATIYHLNRLSKEKVIYPSDLITSSDSSRELSDDRLLLHLHSCVEIWNTKTWTVEKCMNIAINYSCMCLPLAYKHHLAVTCSDGRIKIYNLETGEVEQILQEAAGSDARNLLGTARKSSSFYSYNSNTHYLWRSKD